MTPEQRALYQRLQAYSLDISEVQFPFSQRLARENGWSLDYAQRVIAEYKKFAFLAVVAGHHVTPSDQVDQVWHLHLLYTHLYWDDFCPNILQRSLHHGPTKGGGDESQKFHAWYDRTLSSYEHFFGESPPVDIWPPAAIRFSLDIEGFQRINMNHHWVLPKVQLPFPQWLQLIQELPGKISATVLLNRFHSSAWTIVAFVTAAFVLSGCESLRSPSANPPFNPLNFNGPQFLLFYFGLLMVTVWVARWGQKRLGNHNSEDELPPKPLDMYRIAYLSGGPRRVASVAIAAMVTEGHCHLSENILSRQSPPPPEAHYLETAVHTQLEHPRPLGRIHRNLRDLSVPVRAGFQKAGLIHTKAQMRVAKLAAMPIFALLLLGCLKIYVGMSRNRPTGFLQAFCWITLGLGLYFLLRPLPPTQLAQKVLQTERLRHPSPSAPMAVALGSPARIHGWGLLKQKLQFIERQYQLCQWHNMGLIAAILLAGPWFGGGLALLSLILFSDYWATPKPSNPPSGGHDRRRKGRSSRWGFGSSSSSGSSYGVGCGYTSGSSGDSGGSGGDSGGSGCSSSGCASSGCASSGCGGCGA